MKMLKLKKGFTLIELMIVVAIIGILAAIAIPQFAQLVAKSQEGATKGNLGSIRSALSIYYGDTEGYYPSGANALDALTTNSKYLQVMPQANTPKTQLNAGHGATNLVSYVQGLGTTGVVADVGGWVYDNAGLGGSVSWGNISVSCTHKDIRGTGWSTF